MKQVLIEKKIILIIIFMVFLIFSSHINIVESADPDPPGGGGGGAAVPIVKIKLTEDGKDYEIKPSRLTFKFKNERYAIQVRKIEEDYVKFLYFSFKKGSYKDPRNYKLEESFNLDEDGIKKIDLNEDGYYDLFLKLEKINERTVNIFLKKIHERY